MMHIQALEKIDAHHARLRVEADRLERTLWNALQDAFLDDVAGTFVLGPDEGENADRGQSIRSVVTTNNRFMGGKWLRWQQRTAQRVSTGAVRGELKVMVGTDADALATLHLCLTTTGDAIEDATDETRVEPFPWRLTVRESERTDALTYDRFGTFIPTNLEGDAHRLAQDLRIELAHTPRQNPYVVLTPEQALICARTMVEVFKRGPLNRTTP